MANVVEFIIRAKDDASKALESIGGSLRKVADAGLEPLAKISPTASAAVGGLLDKLGPTGIALSAVAGASVVAVGALASLTKSFADTADNLRDMSMRLGVTVEDLSALKLAADLNGASLDDIGTAFRVMANNLDMAAQKGGPAAEALTRLGVSLQDLRTQTPEQQFETLAKAIAEVPNPTERAALAADVFGRSAGKLLPLINDLAERGMKGLREEAQSLGAVISTDAANAADEFNDQLAKLSAAGQGLMNTLGAALLPAFTEIVTILLEGAKAVVAFEQSTGLLKGTFMLVGEILKGVGFVINTFILGPIKEAIALFNAVADALGVASPQAEKMATAAAAAGPALQGMGAGAEASAKSMEALNKGISAALPAVQGLGKGFEDVAAKLQVAQFADQTATAIAGLQTAMDAGKISAADFAKASTELKDRLAEAERTGIVPTTEAAKQLGTALEKTAYGARELAKANIEAAKSELYQKFMEGKINVDALHTGIQALNAELDALGKEKTKVGAEGMTKVTDAANATTAAMTATEGAVKSVGDSIAETLFNIGAASEETIATLDELIKKGAAAAQAAKGGGGGVAVSQTGGPITASGGVSVSGDGNTILLPGLSSIGGTVLGGIINQSKGSGLTPFNPAYNTQSPSYDVGGVVPGAPHQAVPIVAHGREIVGRPEQIVSAVAHEMARRGVGGGGGQYISFAPGSIQVSGAVVQAERDFDTLSSVLAQKIAMRTRR
jgi:hypothetical protein